MPDRQRTRLTEATSPPHPYRPDSFTPGRRPMYDRRAEGSGHLPIAEQQRIPPRHVERNPHLSPVRTSRPAMRPAGSRMTQADVTRRLAAILAADVVGYSAMMGADEDGTLAALRQIWADTFNPAVAARRGRIVKMMGDGALVEFGSVVDAVECALAVQRAMAERNLSIEPPGASAHRHQSRRHRLRGRRHFRRRRQCRGPPRGPGHAGRHPGLRRGACPGRRQGRRRLRRWRRDQAQEHRAAAARLALAGRRRRAFRRRTGKPLPRLPTSRRSPCCPFR